MDGNKIDIEKITGFASARFSECADMDTWTNVRKNPLHELLK